MVYSFLMKWCFSAQIKDNHSRKNQSHWEQDNENMIGVKSFARNISAYYIDRFHFSIWSGVLILLFTIALLILAAPEPVCL